MKESISSSVYSLKEAHGVQGWISHNISGFEGGSYKLSTIPSTLLPRTICSKNLVHFQDGVEAHGYYLGMWFY
jgi:hypothetical protein